MNIFKAMKHFMLITLRCSTHHRDSDLKTGVGGRVEGETVVAFKDRAVRSPKFQRQFYTANWISWPQFLQL